jgi:hypothetical protein
MLEHLLEERAVPLRHDRDGAPLAARARGPANAVDVRAQLGRQLVVDHGLHVADVETAPGEVRREQKVRTPLPKLVEGLEALHLAQISVELGRAQTDQTKEDLDAVRLLLRAEEDDAARLEGARGEREQHRLALVLLIGTQSDELLLQPGGGLVGRVDLDL